MNSSGEVSIIGAGLCGSLLALKLAQRGYNVTIYEKRADPNLDTQTRGRSINLALSDRGLRGLASVGMEEKARSIAIPMLGRAIHNQNEMMPAYVNYSGRDNEYINSISRRDLNLLMLNELNDYPNVKIHYQHTVETLIEDQNQMIVKSPNGNLTHNYDFLFGTDGANSAIRERFLESSSKHRYDFAIKYLEAGYKELEIPAGPNGTYLLSKNHLHIWPRKDLMMIALPNLDGSFTVTLFMSFDGEVSFNSLQTENDITQFFETYFATASQLMPDLLDDFKSNPTSSLSTIKCYPWLLNSNVLLLGDAAHAIVPFYGQGMNASFEDVVSFNDMLDQTSGDLSQAAHRFQQSRKKDADAIADLASDNFYEMRDATADPVFMRKRKIELRMEQKFPDYFSKYSLVTFRPDLTYHQAMVLGRTQDKILMEIAAEYTGEIDDDDLIVIRDRVALYVRNRI
jgi:kynurenine 3-monooxygenase